MTLSLVASERGGENLREPERVRKMVESPVRRLLAIVLALWPLPPAGAAELYGPVVTQVVEVYDGDTFTVDAQLWSGLPTPTVVQIAGIYAPELRGRCPRERTLALAARDALKAWLPPGTSVTLNYIQPDKDAGRVVADVRLGDVPLADMLLVSGHVRAYPAGPHPYPYASGAREPWC